MRPLQGVRSRLTATNVLVTAAAMGLMLVVVLLATNRLTTSQVESSLEDRITSVESSLPTRAGTLQAPRTGSDEVLDTVWVFDAQGSEVSGPEAGAKVRAEVSRLSQAERRTVVKRGERVYVARPIAAPGDRAARGVAVATESLDVYEGNRNLLLGVLGVVAVLVVAGTAGLTAWTTGRALRPVREMTDAADDWSANHLESRFELRGQDEFARLGRTLDGLLDRVAQAIRTEQQLTGELAHELRTPLTAIRGEAELARLALARDADPHDDTAERLDRIVDQVDRLSRTISSLLALARNTGDTGRRADVGEVVSALVAARPAASVSVDVGVGVGCFVHAAPELVERAVAPLVDNAVRHARTGVEVTVVQRDGHVVVRVSDDGDGVAESDVEAVFEAGFRGSDDDTGAGLGLSLSRRVVTAMGGSLQLVRRVGPTVLEITLPLA